MPSRPQPAGSVPGSGTAAGTTAAPTTGPAPTTAPPTSRAALAVRVIALALPAVALAIASRALDGHVTWGWDFNVYHQVGGAVRHGTSPYGTLNPFNMFFIYTPFAALVLTPLSLLGVGAALAVWTLVNVLALEAVVWMALGLAKVHSPARRVTLTVPITVLMLLLSPVVEDLWLGQINLLILLLIVADFVRGPRPSFGVGIGLAAGLKLTPLIFVPYFLFTRRYRAAAISGGTFAATVLIGLAVLPSASGTYWGHLVMDTQRGLPNGSNLYNESFYGMLTRSPIDLTQTWATSLVSLVVAVTGLAVAVWASRRGHELAGILACAVTGLLASPISWPAHWVWCVPMLVVWGNHAWRSGNRAERVGFGVVTAVIAASTYWAVTPFITQRVHVDAGQQTYANLFLGFGAVILVALAVYLRREGTVPRQGVLGQEANG